MLIAPLISIFQTKGERCPMLLVNRKLHRIICTYSLILTPLNLRLLEILLFLL